MNRLPQGVRFILLSTIPPILSGLLVVGVAFRRLLFDPGFVIYRDLFPGQLYYQYLWHPSGSFLAIENYKFVTFTGPFLPLQALGTDVYEKAVYLSAVFIAYFSFYIAAYHTIGYIRKQENKTIRHIVSVIGATTYLLNPAAANIFFDFTLFVGYAFSPIILLIYCQMLIGKRRKGTAVLLLAVLWWISAIKAHYIIFGGILLLPPIFCWSVFFAKGARRRFGQNIVATVAIVAVYLLLGSYWLIPFLQASQERFIGSYAPATYESLAFLSYTPWIDVVRLLGSFKAWPYVEYVPPGGLLTPLWVISSWMMPGFALAGAIWHRRKLVKIRGWVVWMLIIFSLSGLVLASGVSPPFGGIYRWLMFGPLTPSSFRWLFRVASKWNVFLSLGASGLITLALAELITRIRLLEKSTKKEFALPLGLVLGYCIAFPFFAWPSFSGDFDGKLQPVPLPQAMKDANSWLADQTGDFKVNWLPVTNGRELSWNRRPSGGVYTSLSSQPSIATSWTRHPILFYSYVYDGVATDRIGHLGELLSVLNTRFVAYHDDVVTTHIHGGVEPVAVLIESGEQELTEKIEAQQDIREVWQEDDLTIFEVERYQTPLFVPENRYLATGDLTQLSSLGILEDFQLGRNGIFFDSSRDRNRFVGDWDGLLLGLDAEDDLMTAFIPVENFISPAAFTNHGAVSRAWSRFDIYQFDWQSVLRAHKIYNWGFDYGQMMAAHTAMVGVQDTAEDLIISINVPSDGEYHLWMRYLRHLQAGTLSLSIDGEPLILIEGEDPITGFRWDDVKTIPLNAGEHNIGISNENGFMVVNALALVESSEFNNLNKQAHDLAQSTPSLYMLEAENDFILGNASLTKETTALSSGRAVELNHGVTISTTLSLLAEGEYNLAVRTSLAQSAAPLIVTVGNSEVALHPETDDEDLAWLRAYSLTLPAGELPISIKSAGPAVVDALLMAHSKPGIDPTAFFEQKSSPADIRYEQIDPTRYRVLVQAERPFSLVLAETYDSLWQASGPGFQVSSVPLYGVINGFDIPRSGTYEILVEYQAQQGARLGAILSVGVLISFGPIFFIFRRRRNTRLDSKN